MSILTGIAMILVVLGHLDLKILTFWGLFPYYGFHVLIFVFISGYFYKPADEAHILKYLKRKVLRLMVPYYIWNLVYGIISTILAGKGFIYCSRMNLYNLLIEPFLGGHQYGFNFAAWFVPALFMTELVNIIMRKVLGLIKFSGTRSINLNNDWLIAITTLLVGIAVVYLAKGDHVWGLYKTPGRILFMLPVFEMGKLYKSTIEKHDNLPAYIYYPIVIVLQLITIILTDGAVAFSAVWCSSFMSMCFVPYLTTILGIAFWLRISKDIVKLPALADMINLVGENSFQIMMHHPLVFFVINCITMVVCDRVNAANPFDIASFVENINYVYLVGAKQIWKLVYLVAGIGIPMSLSIVFKEKVNLPINLHRNN